MRPAITERKTGLRIRKTKTPSKITNAANEILLMSFSVASMQNYGEMDI